MKISRFTKGVVILNCAVPAILLAWDALHGDLGANPVNFAIRTTGMLSLIFLGLTLAITPLSRLSGWSWLGQFRRVMGLYAFFHALLHFLLFFGFDRSASLTGTISEIGMRSYLLVGSCALAIMLPLAVTSTNRMIQRLGPKRWKLLHRLTYIVVILGALHFYMLVKADTTRPLIFAWIVGGLFAYRFTAHYLQLRSDSYKLRTAGLTQASSKSKPSRWEGKLKVARIFVETPEVRTFRLVMPTGSSLPFDYLPGQYLNLTLEIEGKKVRRSYTIASSPSRSSYCELTVKREEQGIASRYLHDSLREGDLLTISAPAGRFTFTGMGAKGIVMLAGGVGITPLMSKIRYLTDFAWPGAIHLIFCVRTEADIIFRAELEELQKRFANFRVTVTLTRASDSSWKGESGRIAPALINRIVPDLASFVVHICGPTEMADQMVKVVRELGVSEERIEVESFGSPKRSLDAAATAPAVDANASEPVVNGDVSNATLNFVRSGKTVSDLEGRTVLELAESVGIEIPYDCRSGICGQCKTRLLQGTVVMEAEDALDPVDRANRVILACQARCQDDVEVDA